MIKLLSLMLLLVFVTLGFSQQARKPSAPDAGTSSLQSMVDTERAFAKMSEEQGIRPAFMAFIADDGILFRPTAVKGKQWMNEHPLPPSEKRPLLSWQPTFADISLAGDLGYTTGPWKYKADINDAKPVAWGNFLTVWKRQPDNSWKFVIDLGISNPQPDQVATPWQMPANNRSNMGGIGPKRDGKIPDKSKVIELIEREREFSKDSKSLGAQSAFQKYAASEVRLFRNGKQPIVGKADAAAALPSDTIEWSWTPAFADVSVSEDLGYSYGSYELVKKDATLKTTEKLESGNYYRIWKRGTNSLDGRQWKVVTDLLDPVADAKKN